MASLKQGLARLGLATLTAAGLATAANAVDIKMWTLVTEGYPEFVEQAAAEFKKTHPDVNIIHESIPNEAYKTQIQVALTGSEPPDVFFNWAGEDAARLVRDGLALDITGAPFETSLSEGWKSSFTYEGKRYGVPTDAVSKYFYYDKQFWADHSLPTPTTFNGLLDLCKGSAPSTPVSSLGRSGTPSAGSSTTSSPC